MAAIITDQFRILNAKNFVSTASSSDTAYYAFIGLTNATEFDSNWNISPPSPIDSFNEENDYWDNMVSLKKIYPSDLRNTIRKITWESGITYDMYRHDISRNNPAKPSGALSLYSSNYYVVNSNYRVYICLQNGTNPENPEGRPSLDEPTFTDIEPRTAGSSGDGYIWKYLYTLTPTEIIKFNSIDFIPVPKDWESNSEYSIIRNNALNSGQIKIITIKNRGSGIGTGNITYSNVPIRGNGTGAKATIVVNNDSKVESITVSNGGSGYTYGTVDLVAGGVPVGDTPPSFDVIIPPQNGHGYDIYRELGAYMVSLYAEFDSDNDNPDVIVGNKIYRVGIIRNPQKYNSSNLLDSDKASSLNALKLIGITNQNDYKNASFIPNSYITQTIGTGITAVGRVASYNSETGILKYWQDRRNIGFNTDGTQVLNPPYGIDMISFTSTVDVGGSLNISGGSITLKIDSNFGTINNPGITTVINNKTYQLGQLFINGISNPEIKKYSGDIIYVDNRPEIPNSQNQKIKVKANLLI